MIVLVNKFLLAKGFKGISLWPFVILKNKSFKNDPVLLNHEKVHLKQQAEMLIVFFYVWYMVEFGIRFFQYKNKFLAYRNISFEREAYTNEFNLSYIKGRSFWSFLKYL
ncbi:hypothetical protein BC962_1882 [Gillisia mitskevichiae]|uniref:Beta-lactamase regulating signal transducer with metallopeptidase domain n=1 Tax=Gillisia mitskevichiae TaxID=270921 RepID=A0A495PVV7_9FLAO|nr:hypothetical protein [Gillisia mitskevichiae]RKS53628.1 hypothetical protein BC962_1882 [Gillisia mitskevichiae]